MINECEKCYKIMSSVHAKKKEDFWRNRACRAAEHASGEWRGHDTTAHSLSLQYGYYVPVHNT